MPLDSILAAFLQLMSLGYLAGECDALRSETPSCEETLKEYGQLMATFERLLDRSILNQSN